MAIDIKEALYHFGMITQVTNDELLNILLISASESKKSNL
jgi:hypothetical protein